MGRGANAGARLLTQEMRTERTSVDDVAADGQQRGANQQASARGDLHDART